MKWFIKGLKHYADFSGRARRKEYWMFALFSVIFAAAWSFLGILVFTFLNGSNNIAAENIILIMSYLVVFTLPGMAVAVRRLHDVGKSGWMLLVSLIPIIGGIWLFVLMLTNSQPEENRYGPNPKTSLTTFSEPARLKSAAVVLIVVPIAAFLTQVLQLIAQNLSHGRPIAFGEIIHLVCAALLPVAGFFLWKEKSIFKMRKKGKYAFITILSSVSVSLAVSAYFFGINITHAERLGWQFVPGSLVNGFCLLSAAMFAAAVLFSGQNRSLIRNAAAAAIIFSGIYLLWHVYLSMIVHPAMPILLPVAYIVLAGTFLSREKIQKIKSPLPSEPVEIEEAAQSQPIQRIQLVNAARAVFNNPFSSMVFDPDDTLWKEPIQKELDLLVMGGTKSVVVFDELLMQCASGRGESISHSWWYGSVWAIKTAAMLPRKEAAELMMRLLQQDSNIWEWFSYVQNEAARQLAGIGNADVLPALQNFLEHPPFAMSPVDAIAKTVEKLGGIVKESPSVILSKAQNQLGDGDGIDYLLPFMEQMQSWDSKDKGFYYFLLAKKSERLGYVNAARAFFAAQVAANPVPSDWVWQVFSSEGITPSPENALKLHNKYPVPKTMDEIKSYDVK